MSLIKNDKIQATDFNELKNKIIAEVTGATRRELIVSAWGENNTIPDNDQYTIINTIDHNNLKNGLNTVYENKFSTKSLGDIINGEIDSEDTWAAMDAFVDTLSTYQKKNWKDDVGHAGCDADCRGLCSGCEGECTSCTSCTGGCGETCTGGCKGTCSGECGGCGDTCIGTCKSRCTGGCGNTCNKDGCTNNCTMQCTLDCTGANSGGNTCGTCTGTCSGSCDRGCTGCDNSCRGCSGGCEGSCYKSCTGSMSFEWS